jgi:hypothetical protein
MDLALTESNKYFLLEKDMYVLYYRGKIGRMGLRDSDTANFIATSMKTEIDNQIFG